MNSKVCLLNLVKAALSDTIVTPDELLALCGKVSSNTSSVEDFAFPGSDYGMNGRLPAGAVGHGINGMLSPGGLMMNGRLPAAAVEHGRSGRIPDGCYEGTIKSFNPAAGYGFIACPQLSEKYGCDVFLHQKQFLACRGEIKIGDRVAFRLELSKQGKPQARDLNKVFN